MDGGWINECYMFKQSYVNAKEGRLRTWVSSAHHVKIAACRSIEPFTYGIVAIIYFQRSLQPEVANETLPKFPNSANGKKYQTESKELKSNNKY